MKKQEALSYYMNSIHRRHGYMCTPMDQQQMQSGMAEQEALSTYREDNKLRILRQLKHCTNYGAGVKALEQGTKAIDDLTDQTTDVVFLTDSRSALDALHNQSEPHLSRILHSIIGKRKVVLQWIPAIVVSGAMRWLTNLQRKDEP